MKSSFYFLSSNYPLDRLTHRVKELVEGGWDVGLHGDFGTHDSSEEMKKAVGRFAAGLGFHPKGVREHFLKFDFKKTWSIMEESGFEYDTTVGLNDRLGFKLGLTSPFHPPGSDWSPMKLVELPLTLMDVTLWGYLKLTEGEGYKAVGGLMQRVEEVGGLFTLLWHPESVRMRGGRLYEKILTDISGKKCYTGSGQSMSDWWNARAAPLVLKNREYYFTKEPPKGLFLTCKVSGDKDISVKNGTVVKTGDSYLIGVGGLDFRLSVG
jgi:hypothetical protein